MAKERRKKTQWKREIRNKRRRNTREIRRSVISFSGGKYYATLN
jgi:hypothetical protein